MKRHVPALLLFVAASLLGCGPSAAAPTPPERQPRTSGAEPEPTVAGRAPTAREQQAVRPLVDMAERVRELRFREPVPLRVQTRAEITEFVRSRIEEDELARAHTFYTALGLLPRDMDVQAMLLAVMGEQIVGYYDPDDDLMVVRDDVLEDLSVRGREAESAIVLVHEYVHALQDQHLGLSSHYHEERSIDGENAFASLVEGDATLSMIGALASAQRVSLSSLTRDPDRLGALVASGGLGSGGGSELESAPAIVRVPMLSRYLDGMVLAGRLHGQGGWAAVDDAHRTTLPVSTEQVLHPARYLAGELPEDVEFDVPELAAAGFARVDRDTLGELELSIYLAQGATVADGVAGDRDRAGAEGWGGDRLEVVRRGDELAAVWFLTWDDEREAMEAEASALRVRDLVAVPERPTHAVIRRGRALLVLRGLPADLHPPVLARFDEFAARLRPRSIP